MIYIVRDPRDVASLYHFLRKNRVINDAFPLATCAAEWFIRGKGSRSTWREHVGSWMVNVKSFPGVSGLQQAWSSPNNSSDGPSLQDLGACGHDRQFLLVRYEDLLADRCGVLLALVSL